MKIKEYQFHADELEHIENEQFGKNWPVTYLLTDDKRLYVGETNNAKNRMGNHLKDPEKKGLKNIHIITDKTYNKSVILDLEAYLIQRMSVDNKFKLLNGNGGQNRNNDYYQKSQYLDSFKKVWNELHKHHLVDNDIIAIENSDLFKFSPFKTLTPDQFEVSKEIIVNIVNSILSDEHKTNFILGGAGTGKTVLAVYIAKAITDIFNSTFSILDVEEFGEDSIYSGLTLTQVQEVQTKDLKIGIVISMISLRKTIKKVFAQVPGLGSKMVLGPSDVVRLSENGECPFDLLIVDEAHRLRRRKAITGFGTHDSNNQKLGLDNEGTELNWIMKCSKNQIFFYDPSQSIRTSDIDRYDFDYLLSQPNTSQFNLDTQLRVKAGNEYLSYIKQVLSSEPVSKSIMEIIGNEYEFKIFDSISEMRTEIFEKNKEVGLSRLISGNSWDWPTKKKEYPNLKNINWNTLSLEKYKILTEDFYDFEIEGEKFLWNKAGEDWINTASSPFEVGSNHTTQGYDLNYAGIIFGKEITFNNVTNQIEIIADNYSDKKAKQKETEENIKSFILNSYYVFLTRGIYGTYIYVYDESLRKYLKSIFNLETK